MNSFEIPNTISEKYPMISAFMLGCEYEIKNNKIVIYSNSYIITYLSENSLKVKEILRKLELPENIEYVKSVIDIKNKIKEEIPPVNEFKLPNKVIPNIDNQFTFDNFFVDEPNNMACMMAKNIASEKVKLEIPTVSFVGNTGVGKTHLACAILNEFKLKNNNEYAYFFKKNTFQRLIADSFKDNSYLGLIKYICSAKYVVFDDLVFISELPAVYIKAIYDIVEERINSGLITIFTSPVPFEEINIRDEQILKENSPYFEVKNGKIKYSMPFLSRLKANIRCIEIPSFSLKYAFFKKKLLNYGIDLKDYHSDIIYKIEYIISNIEGDFRAVNNLVNIFMDYYLMYLDMDATVDVLYSKVGLNFNKNSKYARIRFMISKLNDILGVDTYSLFQKKRITQKDELIISCVIAYTLCKICSFKQTLIAEVLNTHRTTILKKIKDFEKNLEHNDKYRILYEKVLNCDTIK